MKKSQYMASAEMQQFMWLSAFVQAMDEIIKTTDIPEWNRRFKTIRTYLKKTIAERMACMDKVEEKKVLRRAQNMGIKVYSYDDARVDKDDFGRKVTVSLEALLTIADAALLECYSCPQGDCVKDCQFRKAFHALGLNCGAARVDPAPGECEFRFDNSVKYVTPQYVRVDEPAIDQLP